MWQFVGSTSLYRRNDLFPFEIQRPCHDREHEHREPAYMTVAGSKAIGYEYDEESRDPVIGEDPTIRPGTIIYNDVVIGDRFTTGHFGPVRERTEIGDDVVVGTNVTIDGTTTVGSNASFQTGAYVPAKSTIGDHVFSRTAGRPDERSVSAPPRRRTRGAGPRGSRLGRRERDDPPRGDSRAGIVRRRRRRRDERRPETNPRGGVAGEPRAASGVASRGNGQ